VFASGINFNPTRQESASLVSVEAMEKPALLEVISDASKPDTPAINSKAPPVKVLGLKS
jgi:hypothetical protein